MLSIGDRLAFVFCCRLVMLLGFLPSFVVVVVVVVVLKASGSPFSLSPSVDMF